jgi:hypothetical protein
LKPKASKHARATVFSSVSLVFRAYDLVRYSSFFKPGADRPLKKISVVDPVLVFFGSTVNPALSLILCPDPILDPAYLKNLLDAQLNLPLTSKTFLSTPEDEIQNYSNFKYSNATKFSVGKQLRISDQDANLDLNANLDPD